MKKVLSLLVALMLLYSTAALAENAGGWTIPEETFMTDNASDAFYGAMGFDVVFGRSA